MFKQTALTSLDSYKLGHADQYPDLMEKVYSNFTPRSDKHLNIPREYKDGTIVWAGSGAFIAELDSIWNDTFFTEPWEDVEAEASIYLPFCGPNGFNMQRLFELHSLGYLPLEIKALPEGSSVPIGVPVLTITNTKPEFYWLPNFLETWLSSELWKMSTSATISRVYRRILEKFSKITGGNKDFIAWQGHDFSIRGMSGIADAAKSGTGHLLFFTGTDNIPAVKLINDVYRGQETFVGGSVPATEHSVMCAGGMESELDTFRRLIQKYPSGVLSIVSDTWDFWKVISVMAKELKPEIEARIADSFGLSKVVFRPDSGDPVKILCGYKVFDLDNAAEKVLDYELEEDGYEVVKTEGRYWTIKYVYDYDGCAGNYEFIKEISEAEAKGAVEVLWDTFGGTFTMEGYKTVSQKVGLIYGDSITPRRCERILEELSAKGFASDNVVFGIGSYTFQYQTRDTLGFAMKATYVEIAGEGKAIFKDPKTDDGVKKSAKGLLAVGKNWDSGKYELFANVTKGEEINGCLEPIFYNGVMTPVESFSDIRNRALSSI